MTDESFGQRIRRLRIAADLSHVDLAGKMNRSTSWVSQVERDAMPIERFPVLQALAAALNVPLHELRPDLSDNDHTGPTVDTSEERLMRYATAIGRCDLDYILGPDHPDHPLPDSNHSIWENWKRTAGVVIRLADNEHPPPPGSTEERLPEHILGLVVLRSYLSTACQMAHALQSAITRHPEHKTELELWRDRMHSRCRLNNKFSDVSCACPHHKGTVQ